MESTSEFIVFLIFSLAAFAGSVPSPRNSIIIGDHLYFTDVSSTLRSHDQALSYCQSQDAELAKVTNKTLYDRLRLALANPSTYWIDGIDKENHERFSVNQNCSPGHLDYSDMSQANLRLPARTCLSLVKGTTASNSRIQAMDCVIPNRVLCSFALDGCHHEPSTSTTTTMRSGD